jgi:hypothetical protein
MIGDVGTDIIAIGQGVRFEFISRIFLELAGKQK